MPHWIGHWPLGPVATAALAIALAAAVIGGYLLQFRKVGVARRPSAPTRGAAASLLGLRLLAVAAVLWMLSDAAYQTYQARPETVWVCIDRSASMLVADLQRDASTASDGASGGPTRFERAVEAAEGLAAVWTSQHRDAQEKEGGKVRYFLLGESGQEADVATLHKLAAAAKGYRRGGGSDFDRVRHAVEAEDGFAASSPLGDALSSLQPLSAIERPAAVVVISDGNVTGGLELGAVSLGGGAAGANAPPVFTLAAGAEEAGRRLAIAGVAEPSLVFAGDPVTFAVRVETQGLAGRRIQLQLRSEAGGPPLASEVVEVGGAGSVTEATLEAVAPQVDRWPLRVFAELEESPTAGEGAERMRAEERFVVPVRSEPVRVLLIAETYGYETRFVKHLFERTRQRGDPDAAVFEPTFCIAAAQQPLVQTDPQLIAFLPVEEQWWEQFELCVVIDPPAGRFDPALADALESAARRQGCGVVFIAGKLHAAAPLAAEPWRSLLPVTAGGDSPAGGLAVSRAGAVGEAAPPVRWRWTEAAVLRGGWDATLAIFEDAGDDAVPALLWHCEVARPKPTAAVLAVADPLGEAILGRPAVLLAEHIVGAGRAAFVGSDELYRWRTFMGSERLYLQFYSDLFASVVKRPGADARPTVRVDVPSERFASGERVRVSAEVVGEGAAELFEDTLAIRLTGETGSAGGPYSDGGQTLLLRRSEKARYEVALENLPPGGYSLRAAEEWEGRAALAGRLGFRVDPPPGELAALDPEPAALRELAESSGGRAEPLERWRELAASLPPPHALQFEPLPPKSVWNSPWVVGLIVAALSVEWYLRNRWGLL